jgi:hypothetical protein
MKKGNYLGTEIDGVWCKRYRAAGFFARGSGEFWMDETGISFRRLLTEAPLTIPWGAITGSSLGSWHAGQWILGRPILKIEFQRDDRRLCAGFCLSRTKDRAEWQRMEQLVADLERKLAAP